MRPLLIVLGVLVLIGCVPVSIWFRYFEETELKLVIAGIFRWRLLPKKTLSPAQQQKQERNKAKKAETEEKKKQKKSAKASKPKAEPEQKQEKKPLGDRLETLIPWAKLAARFAGEFCSRKLCVTRLRIRVALAGGDPAKTGMSVARAWQTIGIALPILERAFRIRERKIAVYPEFQSRKTQAEAELCVRLRIGGVLLLVLKYALKALRLWLHGKREAKQQKQEQTGLLQNDEKAG